jgi:ABC-type Mn2+/Zn2+ transport system ATPase subunit
MDCVLETHELSLGYGQKTVLRGVNLAVRAGEFWCFLGQNGVGKTTLLRAFLGLLQPQAGRLLFHPELGRRECMGFVPQRCDLNPTLPITVREFALLGLVGIRAKRTQQQQRLAWALEKVNLSGRADTDYWSLSGGQRQRVLVARALVRRPTLLILDEPTNNLDLSIEDTFLQTLSTLHAEERNTVLLVTHNVHIAARYATHIGLIAAGTLVPGPREQVLTTHNLERAYGRVTGLTSQALPDSAKAMKVPEATGRSPM